ncbi:hypothetical protein BV25DRAFT_1870267 [Artomyces pyxidatus]|uniref:Uncharacterized protein n=1 Tax=Artomyces pyxidatus TaxID=48021 RepID=A0ACB8T3C0_9AGAM|nr:hypothetical protein BV25DRAFT_1870267 [Artomyces pyxidatus]
MSLFKIPLLLVSSTLVWKAFTPPSLSRSPPTEKIQPQRGGIEQFVGSFVLYHAYTFKVQYCLGCLCEIALVLACNSPHLSIVYPTISTLTAYADFASMIRITPHFLAGFALVVVGAVLRLACYRELGRQFTFELVLRDKHQLITTGPYSFVRHPSYTGLFCLFVGGALVLFGHGSWFWEGGAMNTPVGSLYFAVWVLWRAVSAVNLLVRTVSEDRFLKEAFGNEWVEWETTTPYKVVPFIY